MWSRFHGAPIRLALVLTFASGPALAAGESAPSAPVGAAPPPSASQSAAAPDRELERLMELRNTVGNLLKALVDAKVITAEQAAALVRDAQTKASTEASARAAQQAAQEKAEEGAIRVPYVPQIVKDDIARQVEESVTPEVTKQVVAQAKSEAWGIPAALPDWLHRVTVGGDVRVRAETDDFAKTNLPDTYLNFNAVNSAGGIAKAGDSAFVNSTINRTYLVNRLRLDIGADLGSGWSVGSRLSTGTLLNPDSTNQVEGQYGGRYTTDIDLSYIRWKTATASGRQSVDLVGGKFPNPYLSSDIVWDTDVTFEGLAATYQVGFTGDAVHGSHLFTTLAAVPVQEIALSQDDKWLYSGQVGVDLPFADAFRVRVAGAYYYYDHLHGELNALNSTLLNYTAPTYVQKGNTLFNIANSSDPTAGLFALAADYHLVDGIVAFDWLTSPGYRLSFTGDWVRNVGFNAAAVEARVGSAVRPRVTAWQGEFSFGTENLERPLGWRAFAAYKYIERDAVVDAFDDQDFHLGGTDARGYLAGVDLGITRWVWARLRYLTSNAIDGPPLGIDTWQLDLNARF